MSGSLHGHRWPALSFAALVLLLFPSSGQDDFFITLWPAMTLAEQGRILNYNGQALEQSSALLLAAVLGASTALTGLDPAVLARWLSAACALACVLGLRRAVGLGRQPAFLARWLLALSAPFLYWAASGTEMPIQALLLLLWTAVLRSSLEGVRLAAAFVPATAAVIINRPEGSFICLCVLGALCLLDLIRRSARRLSEDGPAAGGPSDVGRAAPSTVRAGGSGVLLGRWSAMALGTLLCFGLVALWRELTFGSPWPLPVSAKMGGVQISDRLASGFSYLVAWNGLGLLGLPLLLVAVYAGMRLVSTVDGVESRDRGTLISALVAAAYVGFAVTSGGDWMEAGRFLVPAMPFLAAVAAHGIVAVPYALSPRRARGLAFALLVFSALQVIAVAKHPKTRALPLWQCGQLSEGPFSDLPWAERSNKAQLRDVAALSFLDDLVDRASRRGETPLALTSHQMGYVAYSLSRRHPGQLRFIDAAGLVEPSLAKCQAIRDRVSHNAGGLWRKGYAYDPRLKVRFLLENVFDCAGELPAGRAGASPIDVLYELGIPDDELLAEYGLTAVYVQDGRFLRRPSFTFVALRNELVSTLGFESVRVVEFGSRGGVVDIRQQQRPLARRPGSASLSSPSEAGGAGR